MKRVLTSAAVLAALTGAASAQYNPYGTTPSHGSSPYGLSGTGSNPSSHTVAPYVNTHGTYVGGSHATHPNATQTDNFSATGNVNPYTGAVGTHRPRY